VPLAGKPGREVGTSAGEGWVASQGRTDETGRTPMGGGRKKEIRWGEENTVGPRMSLSGGGIWKNEKLLVCWITV
jgi:hypothetical protein